MKKSLKTLSILLAALAIGSFAGCKTEADLGDSVGNWKGVDKDKDAKPFSVTLTADEADIDWWCWSDSKGQILDNAKFNPATRSIKQGKSVTWEFADNNEYRLSFHQVSNAKDFRGAVKPNKGYGLKISAKNHPQEVTQQAEVWLINNEPQNGSYFPDGDYTINEVWVLQQDPKDKDHIGDGKKPGDAGHVGAKYIADEGLKYKGLSIAGSANNTNKVGFLVPAGKENVIAIQQEKRASGDKAKEKKIEYWIQDDGTAVVYITDKPANGKKDVENIDYVLVSDANFKGTKPLDVIAARKKAGKPVAARTITKDQLAKKDAEYWGKRVELEAHKSNYANPIKTWNITEVKFDRNGITSNFTNLNGKFAVAVDEVTVVPGDASEK